MAADDVSTFEPLVGTVFDADVGGQARVPLRLAEVQRLPEQAGAPRRQPFALIFTGPVDPPLPQRTYAVEHPVAGSLELFVVPVGPDAAGAPRYEAVFN